MLKQSFLITFLFILSGGDAFSFQPNPRISDAKTIVASSGTATALIDRKYGVAAWQPAVNEWVALNVGTGPSKILFLWNCTNYMWSDSLANPGDCAQGLRIPRGYTLAVSGNSTDGSDGTWTTAVTVDDNVVAARAHAVDFIDNSWIKLTITNGENAKFDEVEVFDISGGADDTWFFGGTSITANAFKGPVQTKTFADYVTEKKPTYTPAFIRGGIGCIKLEGGLRNDIKKYVTINKDIRYFALEIGTNDAWGGSAPNNFAIRLQHVIDTCIFYGLDPLIARTIATNANWQIHEGYLTIIDSLTEANGLHAGPDLYSYFLNHPEELGSDGIHPNATGAGSIQRLWAEVALAVYDDSSTTTFVRPDKSGHSIRSARPAITAISTGTTVQITTPGSGLVSLYNAAGICLVKNRPCNGALVLKTLPHGMVMVNFTNVSGTTFTCSVLHR